MSNDKNNNTFKIIRIIDNIAHSKFFGRSIGFILLLLIIVGNIDFEKIKKTFKKDKATVNVIPQNVNKNIVSTFEDSAKSEKLQIEREMEKVRVDEENKNKIESLKKEFKDNKSKNGKKIKINDVVNVKILITYKDDFDTANSPMQITVIADKNDAIGKNLIGKTIGNVVVVPLNKIFREMNIDFNAELAKIQKENPDLQSDFQMEEIREVVKKTDYKKMFNESPMVYRIKILGFFKKEAGVKKILE
ncbi:MAG: hypothetical protein LBC92_02805 [Rickettsiales bacterium]|jgi:hypothetical protein|nr:hypothetical protein [Rickettsiales bacterium]